MKKIIKTLLLFIMTITILYIYKIVNIKYNIGIPCIFHKITNLYCPGCGITRAIFSLLELDIKTAIQNNLLFFILIPFLTIYIINYINIKIYDKKIDPSEIISKKTWYALLIVTIVFGIIRNINYFYWLQPI